MKVEYSLATALTEHSVPAVKKAITDYGIIGVTKYGEKGYKDKDRAVIEHALSLVAAFQKYSVDWWNENGDKHPRETGWPSDILDCDYDGEYHTMGWELEPDFIDTNPSLAKADPRQYRNQLILIAALCEKHDAIDHAASGSAATVRKLVESIGQQIDEDTVLKYLREIPEALSKKQSE
jgi:hypothetical protein